MTLRRDVRDWVQIVKHRVPFPKTHDVLELLALAHPLASNLELLRLALEHLEPFAVALRYPGEFASRAEAQRVVRLLTQIRFSIRPLLQLS